MFTKKLIIIATALSMLSATVYALSAQPGSTAKASATPLEKLFDKGIIEGYDDGNLHPERTLTRAQFAKILNKAFPDFPHHDLLHSFSDLSPEHWAYDYIQIAANAGWLCGYDDNTFRPDKNITYEQAVAVLCRILGIGSNNDYPKGYLAAAIDYSVTDGINALIGEEIDRARAAILIENAQLADIKETTGGFSFFAHSGGAGSMTAGYTLSECAVAEPEIYDDGFSFPFLPDRNTEEYSAYDENIFKNVLTSPLSTFSIDTDTASYSNLRRFILNGQEIPNGSVRSEELINYFDYSPAVPENGKPFGVKYTVCECPWNTANHLAMITVSGEELQTPKPSNLVFLIDVSGSMYSFNKLPLVKKSLSMLLDKLGESDRISIVTYASDTRVALKPTPAAEKDKIMSVIDNLTAGGSTAGASGINLAYEQAEKFSADANNRIILCTDGDFNVGISSDGDLKKLITEKREKGIFLTVLGFGMGNYKDNRMETLADNGNGGYAYIDNLREAKKVLVDELPKTIYTIAKDVKIQTEFNPEKVAEYRLIGYENRALNNEDFDNDKKDAGELGAGATVTVLYELVPADGEVSSDLKYQTTQPTGSDELMTVKIRYKLPDSDESSLAEYPVLSGLGEETEDFCFAAAVAELGMILNDSEYKGSSTYDSVTELAQKGIGKDTFGLRTEFLQLCDLLRYESKK